MRMTLASFRCGSRGRGISLCSFSNLPANQCSASNASLHLATRPPAPERISAPGGFLMPGEVKFEARVAPLILAHPVAPFDSQIPVRFPIRGGFLTPF
jgi:hypothetical protein